MIGRRALLAGSTSLLSLGARASRPPACIPAGLPPPPVTPRHPVRIERFGRVRIDEYAWLHQPDWFTALLHPDTLDPAIRAHLDAENAYADAVMQPEAALQAELLAEMGRRAAGVAQAPPEPDGDWTYWSQVPPGAQHPSFLRRPRAGGAEQLLADFDQLARGRRYYSLSSLKGPAHSPDGRLFAWAADETGDEHFRLYVRDLATGELVGPPALDCFGEFVFSPDSRWLFWLLRDQHSRPSKVFRRPAHGGPDTLVYEEHDPAFFVTLSRTASNGFVLITVLNASATEIWLIPGSEPTAPPRVAQPRQAGLQYELEHWGGDAFVVRTNADGATDYKLMTANAHDLSRAGWRPWIGPTPGRSITAMRAFRNHFARIEWVDANPVLITVDRSGGSERHLGCSDPAYGLELDADAAYDSPLVRYSCQSPRRPVEWWSVDMTNGRRTLLSRQTVPGFDPDRYAVRRIDAPAADGASVPISLLMRRGQVLDGSAPLLLFGYGAYGFSLVPEFDATRLSLVDRGWVVAIAHVRGGAERGFGWYEQTLKRGKTRTITDFIDCAAHLAQAGYTRPGRIVGHSYSAGGILIGGAINLRPDLFAGAIAEVPFVDVLNTLHDSSNPLVASALPIWGDPSDPAMFDVIAGYAPYENVVRQAYPAVLATAGLLDDRVGYWEAAKWIARLRERSTSGKPLMLRTNMHAGHQGDAGEDDVLARTALFWTFAIVSVSGRWTCN